MKIRNFKEGDLVLRKVTQNTRKRSDGVLAPNWEGPYLIKMVVQRRAYKLEDMDGYLVDQTWNAERGSPQDILFVEVGRKSSFCFFRLE